MGQRAAAIALDNDDVPWAWLLTVGEVLNHALGAECVILEVSAGNRHCLGVERVLLVRPVLVSSMRSS